jgi:hypothetical protein
MANFKPGDGVRTLSDNSTGTMLNTYNGPGGPYALVSFDHETFGFAGHSPIVIAASELDWACECNGGPACDCPGCEHPDCAFQMTETS